MPRKKTPRVAVLNTREAAAYVGLSKSTLEKKRGKAGGGPVFVRLGGAIRYRQADLDQYIRERLWRGDARLRP